MEERKRRKEERREREYFPFQWGGCEPERAQVMLGQAVDRLLG